MSDMSCSHLLKRGSVYYFRAKVPVDLLDHYAPKTEVKFSLKTKDRREAIRLVHIESARLDEEFQRIRQLMNAAPVTELSPQDVRSMANAWLSQLLELDEFNRKGGLTGHFADMYEEGLIVMEEEGREALATGNTALIDHTLRAFLDENGYKVDPKSAAYRDLAYEFMKAAMRANEMMLARQRGRVIDTPEPPALPSRPLAHDLPAESTEGSLSQLLKQWRIERQPIEKTWAEFDLAVRRFLAFHTDLPIKQIKKTHVVQFKDRLLEEGKSTGTIIKQLGALRTVLQYAVDNDKLELNPAVGVKVAQGKHDKEKRLPYELGDLKLIFSSPVYKSGERPTAGAGQAAFWLPLLALFTGARLEELGQAHVADVKEEDEVMYLEISDRQGDKRVKTKTSRRRIPLHQELLRCGFRRYVDEIKKGKHQQLFPELKADHMGKLTGNWSKWWGRYAREIGIMDKRKVFHSFRHSFKDACRECGIEEAIHDALTGHSGGGLGRSYGGQMYPLPPLVKAMTKLKYKGLELIHRMSSGTHKRWEREKADGSLTITELHKYPASRGRVLRHIGEQLGKAAELLAPDFLAHKISQAD